MTNHEAVFSPVLFKAISNKDIKFELFLAKLPLGRTLFATRWPQIACEFKP